MLNYTIVGGASLVLHRLHIPVKDIDIETDKEAVSRFQELFSIYTINKISMKKGHNYCSHFESFTIEGTNVDVRGNLH